MTNGLETVGAQGLWLSAPFKNRPKVGGSFQILGRPLVIFQARFWGLWKSKVCVRLCKTNIAVNIYQWFESGKKWALGPCYFGVRRAKKNAADHDDQRRICPSFLVVALV